MTIRIHFEHQTERGMLLVGRRLSAKRNVIRRDQLLRRPIAPCEATDKRNAARPWSARRRRPRRAYASAPRSSHPHSPQPMGFARRSSRYCCRLHPDNVPQHNRRDVRRVGSIGIAASGRGPERRPQRGHVLVERRVDTRQRVQFYRRLPVTNPGFVPSPCSPAAMLRS